MPPLILHPFADAGGPGKLVESSRASLKLQGLLPPGEATREDLDRALLDGRYSELRMLFYVGKDLARWIEQCLEFVEPQSGPLFRRHLSYQSFADLLVQDAPAAVQTKLRKWGVGDYKSIFSRALGLHCLFADAPPRELLSDEFVRNYYRFADQIFSDQARRMRRSRAQLAAISHSSCIRPANTRGCWNAPGANRPFDIGSRTHARVAHGIPLKQLPPPGSAIRGKRIRQSVRLLNARDDRRVNSLGLAAHRRPIDVSPY